MYRILTIPSRKIPLRDHSRKLVVVIHNPWHIVASSVGVHASELIPGSVTFVVSLNSIRWPIERSQ
jgi:hypothetical protein